MLRATGKLTPRPSASSAPQRYLFLLLLAVLAAPWCFPAQAQTPVPSPAQQQQLTRSGEKLAPIGTTE